MCRLQRMPEHLLPYAVVGTALVSLLSVEFLVVRGPFAHMVAALLTPLLPDAAPLVRHAGWAMGVVLFYFVLPALVIRYGFGHSLGDYGWSARGYRRHWWIYLVIFLPILGAIILVASHEAFQRTYPFYEPANIFLFLIGESIYAIQFVALEFFFRGFLLHGTRKQWGNGVALLIMLVPYVWIHYSKPRLEMYGAAIFGLVLGWLAIRTRSIAGGITAHLMVAWSVDTLVLWYSGWFSR